MKPDFDATVNGRKTIVASIDGTVLVSTVRIPGLRRPWETMVFPRALDGSVDMGTTLRFAQVKYRDDAMRNHESACRKYAKPSIVNPIIFDRIGYFKGSLETQYHYSQKIDSE